MPRFNLAIEMVKNGLSSGKPQTFYEQAYHMYRESGGKKDPHFFWTEVSDGLIKVGKVLETRLSDVPAAMLFGLEMAESTGDAGTGALAGLLALLGNTGLEHISDIGRGKEVTEGKKEVFALRTGLKASTLILPAYAWGRALGTGAAAGAASFAAFEETAGPFLKSQARRLGDFIVHGRKAKEEG